MNNKKRLTQMLSFISATLGIVCIACFFFPFLSITREGGSEGFYSGMEVCLGYSDSIVRMGMNILLIANLVILLVTALITLTKYQSKIANITTAILFIVSTLLTFLLPIYAKALGNMMIGSAYELGLAWGSAVCGIVSLIATVLNFATLILNKKIDNEPLAIDPTYYEGADAEQKQPETITPATDTTDDIDNTPNQ